MTFKQAKAKLKKLAGKEYHTVCYELKEKSPGSFEAICTIYIHNETHYNAPTWERAFEARERALETPVVDKSEMPKEELN